MALESDSDNYKIYSSAALDQNADSVWVMILNCLDHNNAYLQ